MTKAHVFACGEACVDEITHLPPDEAGEALGHAVHWLGIDLERRVGDAAALSFYSAVIARAETAKRKLEGYKQNETVS